jgi:hypothetical protein
MDFLQQKINLFSCRPRLAEEPGELPEMTVEPHDLFVNIALYGNVI